MSNSRPKVTVIIPVYNQPNLLKEALESVLDQTYSNYDVIVVDDNSSKDISVVTQQFGKSVNLVIHSDNMGAAAARNTGIDKTKGQYIAFLDADDTWKPTKLEKQIEKFRQSSSDTGLVYTGMLQKGVDGSQDVFRPKMAGDIYLNQLREDNILPTSTVMIKRSCVKNVGKFDPELPSRQDYDLWIRVSEKFRVDYVNEPLVVKREQADNISRDYKARVKGDLAVFEKVKKRTADFDKRKRDRIFASHHHTIGRDLLFNGQKKAALKHLWLSIRKNPCQTRTWGLLLLTILNVEPGGNIYKYIENQLN